MTNFEMIGLSRYNVGITNYGDILFLVKESVDVLCLISLPYKVVLKRHSDIIKEELELNIATVKIVTDYVRKENTQSYYEFIDKYITEYMKMEDYKEKFKWYPRGVNSIYINSSLVSKGKYKTQAHIILDIFPFRIEIVTNPFNPFKRKLKDVNIESLELEYVYLPEPALTVTLFRTLGDLSKFNSIRAFLDYLVDKAFVEEKRLIEREIKKKEERIETLKEEMKDLKEKLNKLNDKIIKLKNSIEDLHREKVIY